MPRNRNEPSDSPGSPDPEDFPEDQIPEPAETPEASNAPEFDISTLAAVPVAAGTIDRKLLTSRARSAAQVKADATLWEAYSAWCDEDKPKHADIVTSFRQIVVAPQMEGLVKQLLTKAGTWHGVAVKFSGNIPPTKDGNAVIVFAVIDKKPRAATG